MSEDEAFIRAIVGNPGDDTPRLVYADWLDERDDPRGPYLRAERESVGDAKHRERIAALDPVWVARISRPPIGVCCDRVQFRESGPQLDAEDVEHVEQRLGVTLPPEFRAFLLNHNGGTHTPAHLPYPPSLGWDDMDMEIGGFYTATRRGLPVPERADFAWEFEIEGELGWLHSLYADGGDELNPLLADLVPIAHTIHDLGYLLVGVGKANRGRVFHFRDYCHFTDDPDHLFQYADSVPQLLSILRPERDNP
jgi:uncharacterized protein (TIGR02996 family)